MSSLLMCPDSIPNLWGFIDTTIAPPLLFYSYIPIFLLSIFLGIFVYVRSKHSLISKTVLAISISFALWIFNALFQWMAVHVAVVHFSWELIAIIEIAVYLFSLYFFYVYLYREDAPLKFKITLILLALPIVLLTATKWNIMEFDLTWCEGTLGPLWIYVYALEMVIIIWHIILGVQRYRTLVEKVKKIRLLYAMGGVVAFLLFFHLSNVIGELTQIYVIEYIGPVGLLLFILGITILVVRYSLFNIKVFASQALIFGIIFFNFAILFINDITIIHIVLIVTLVLTAVLGLMLVRSVATVERQKIELAEANDNQEKLLHFISHQVKGVFTRSINVYSEMLTGSYGPITDDMRWLLQQGLDSERKGVKTVQDIFFSADLRKGTSNFDLSKDVHLNTIIQEVFDLEEVTAKEKGLRMNLVIPKDDVVVKGDADKLREVFKNLIENAINYTPEGEVHVSLHREKEIVFAVKDNGFGLSEEDKKVLFTEGGRGKDSASVNPNTSGYGLYICQQIVEAHGGHIWAESKGRNLGSTFKVAFPLKQK